MAKVYLLSTYQEDGAEEVRATTDPARLASMLGDYYESSDLADEYKRLADLLAKGELIHESGEGLGRGWGGVQLHIVELE